MSDRDLLLKCLMGAILSPAQREVLQGYLLRVETGLPLSHVARRQIRYIAVAARILEPPAAPKLARPGGMYEDGSYSSKRSAGTDFAEQKVLQSLPAHPPKPGLCYQLAVDGKEYAPPAPPGRRRAG